MGDLKEYGIFSYVWSLWLLAGSFQVELTLKTCWDLTIISPRKGSLWLRVKALIQSVSDWKREGISPEPPLRSPAPPESSGQRRNCPPGFIPASSQLSLGAPIPIPRQRGAAAPGCCVWLRVSQSYSQGLIFFTRKNLLLWGATPGPAILTKQNFSSANDLTKLETLPALYWCESPSCFSSLSCFCTL